MVNSDLILGKDQENIEVYFVKCCEHCMNDELINLFNPQINTYERNAVLVDTTYRLQRLTHLTWNNLYFHLTMPSRSYRVFF